MNKIYGAISLVAVLAIAVGLYLFHEHQQKLALDQNAQCHNLAVAYWQNAEATFAGQFSNQTKPAEPQSHFNNKLNRCLGDFEVSIYIPSSTSSAVDVLLDKEIVDVGAGKVLLNSTTDTGDGSEMGQVSEAEFNKQEAILMSQ